MVRMAEGNGTDVVLGKMVGVGRTRRAHVDVPAQPSRVRT